jgi:uncharacterized protein YigA (DUF484 family)
MAQVIQFEMHAVARLRERLGAIEEANEDLIAFARGHSGAVATIHAAALEAVGAAAIDELLTVVTCRWPEILGIDAAAIALIVGDRGFRADSDGIEPVEVSFVERMLANTPSVDVRTVRLGHALFGPSLAAGVRAEALIRIDSPVPYPTGLLALGQYGELEVDSGHGSGLLRFLGRIVEAALRRCVATA